MDVNQVEKGVSGSVIQSDNTDGEAGAEQPVACDRDEAVTGMDDDNDWRTPIIRCLWDPGGTKDKKVQRQSLKYVMVDDELYQRTMEDLLLKCLDEEGARIAMGEVHEGLCGTHQSAAKMKWILK
jgi:hypothetical protein